MNKCACGCGKDIKRKWYKGHNRRGNPPTNKIGVHIEHGYAYIYMPTHPRKRSNGYVKRAGLVIESHIGRFLTCKEVAHHIDKNKLNDSLDNLMLLSKPEHDRISVLVSEKCLHPGCNNKHKARGLCCSHYGKYYRAKKEMPLIPSRKNRWTKNDNHRLRTAIT